MRSISSYSQGTNLWTQRRKIALASCVSSCVLLLSACGNVVSSQPQTEVTKEVKEVTKEVQTVESTAVQGTASTPDTEQSETVKTAEQSAQNKSGEMKTPQGFNLPRGAYPKAGGPVPPEATKLKVVRNEDAGTVAVMKTPTGNIGCDLGTYDGQDIGGCGIYDIQNPPLVDWDGQGKQKANWAEFSAPDGAHPTLRTDIAFFQMAGKHVEVVPYGKVVYYQNFVCASEKVGLTCWNTKTGHGAFLNHKTMKFF